MQQVIVNSNSLQNQVKPEEQRRVSESYQNQEDHTEPSANALPATYRGDSHVTQYLVWVLTDNLNGNRLPTERNRDRQTDRDII